MLWMLLQYDSIGRFCQDGEYQGLNRAVKKTAGEDEQTETTYTYNALGKVASVKDPEGNITNYTYDSLGRMTQERTPGGGSTSYVYDSLGRVTKRTDPVGGTQDFVYNGIGQIIKVIDKNGAETQYVYDAAGNIIETMDALQHSTYFEYDRLNRLTKVRLNRIGSGTSVGEEQITLFEYDGRGLITKEINAAAGETVYSYDPVGNLIEKTEGGHYTTTYAYDKRNLVTAINYSNLSAITFTYDAAGQLVAMNDELGTTSFTLDVLGQIVSVNDHNNKTVGYTYNQVGDKTSVTYPDGSVVRYGYDNAGKLSSVTEGGKETRYGYTPDGYVASIAYPNGVVEEYAYDSIGKLQEVKTAGNVRNEYVYDLAGNLTEETSADPVSGDIRTTFYTYDLLNRISSYTEGNSSSEAASPTVTTYEYDSLSNLVNENGPDGSISYTYNRLNQMSGRIGADGTSSYSYDSRGNLITETKDGSQIAAYTYHAMNKLATGTTSAGASTYTYNGFGHLVSLNGTDYVIDYSAEIPRNLVEGEGSTAIRLVYGLDVIKADSLTDSLYIHTDRQGSPRLGMDENGEAVAFTKLSPWGKLEGISQTTAADEGLVEVLKNYTGHPYDENLGLYYAKARMYSPDSKRFISTDPLKDAIVQDQNWWDGIYPGDSPEVVMQLSNLYVYCGSNPVGRVDLTGEAWYHWALIGGVVAIAVVATVVTAGGTGPAIVAVISVANGVPAATAGATVAASGFLGASTVTLGTLITADYSSAESFSNSADAFSVIDTALGGLYGTVFGCVLVETSQRNERLRNQSVVSNGGSGAGKGGSGTAEAQIPRTGDEWHKYFNETYGKSNVTWESANINNIVDMPSKIVDFTPQQVSELAKSYGWSVEPLGKGSAAGVPFDQGGGFSMHAPNGGSEYIQYHPGGGHHGADAYYKISSGPNGTVRYNLNGGKVQ